MPKDNQSIVQANKKEVDQILNNKDEISLRAEGPVDMVQLKGIVRDLRKAGIDVNVDKLDKLIFALSYFKLSGGPFIVDIINEFGFDIFYFTINYLIEAGILDEDPDTNNDRIREAIRKATFLYSSIHQLYGRCVENIRDYETVLRCMKLDGAYVVYGMADYEIKERINYYHNLYKPYVSYQMSPINFLILRHES